MNRSTPLKFLFGLFFPLLAICLYYLTNKPVTPALMLALLAAAWRILVTLALTGLAGGLGRAIIPLDDLPALERIALQAALGLGLIALTVLVIGSTAGLSIWLWAVIILAGLVLLRKPLRAWLADWADVRDLWRASDRIGRTIGWMLVLALGAMAVMALAPPLKYDALMYHLTMPKAYLAAGRITYLDWIVMSGHPQNAEMLYTLAISFGGSEAAALFGWVFAPLTAVGLLGYLRPRLGARPAWVSLAALFAGYSLTTATADAYVDWLGLLFGFACLVLMEHWEQAYHKRDILLAGMFAGLALGTKYTAGVLGLTAGVALLWHIWRNRWPLLKNLGWFALGAAIFSLPWLVKNLVTTGNPLYPFFVPAGAMDTVRIAVYQGLPPYGNWLDFFFLPFRAVMMGVEGAEGYSVSMGPLLLGLGGLAWLGARQRSAAERGLLVNAAVFSLSGLVVWAVGNRLSGYLIQTRMYFPLFPAFAVLAACGYQAAAQIKLPQVRLGRILNMLIVLVLGLNSLATLLKPVQAGALSTVLGYTDQNTYLENNLGMYQLAVERIDQLEPSAKVLWIYEPRSLGCYPQCLPDEILDRWVRSYSQTNDYDTIRQNMINEGFTHLMVNRAGVEFLKENPDPHHPLATLLALDEFLSRIELTDRIGDAYELYLLK